MQRGRIIAVVGGLALVGLTGCGSGHDGHSGSGAAAGTTTSARAADAVDRAFVAQMVPHHEMAVEMAALTDRRARHAEIRRLGAEITRTQEAEISAMRRVAGRLGVRPAAGSSMDHGGGHAGHGGGAMSADAKTLGLSMDAMGMSMDMASLRTADPFDRAFIDEMIPHHQGAIRMARAELERGTDPELRRIARAIVTAQEQEIARMNAWPESWYGAPSPAGGVPAA